MKLLLEKWKAYVQDCKNAEGKEGKAVVKKDGSDKIESCHTSKDKAEAAVRARYANYKSESLDEMSAMGGGAVQGYAAPMDDEREELEEMFSTSTQTGGVPQSKVSAEEEHEGHVERSKHQGLRNVTEERDTKWKLSDFADNPRNAARVFDVLKDVIENIGLEKLKNAAISDLSSESRVDVMANKFGYDSDLLEKIKNDDEEAIKKYYQFLINEFLFWSTYNPMASASQYAGRRSLLSKPIKDLAYSHIYRYVKSPSVNNPKSLGQRIRSQADDYELDPDLDPSLYELPEE